MNKTRFKNYSIIIRSILAIVILYFIYRETGFFTTLAFLLIYAEIELINIFMKGLGKNIDELLKLAKNEFDFYLKKDSKMNNYPTADLKSEEYETRQIDKRICENCINSRKSKYRSKIRCLIWNELCNRNDNCLYFFSEIK